MPSGIKNFLAAKVFANLFSAGGDSEASLENPPVFKRFKARSVSL
jgi:hypothetical protein